MPLVAMVAPVKLSEPTVPPVKVALFKLIVPVPALMLTSVPVVLMAAVVVMEVLPLFKLKPLGAVMVPKLVIVLVAVLKFKAPEVRVAAKVPAVMVPAADCVTVLPMLVKVRVPVPTVEALLKLVPPAEVIKALPFPVVVNERLVAEMASALALEAPIGPEAPIVPPKLLAAKFNVPAVMTFAPVSVKEPAFSETVWLAKLVAAELPIVMTPVVPV